MLPGLFGVFWLFCFVLFVLKKVGIKKKKAFSPRIAFIAFPLMAENSFLCGSRWGGFLWQGQNTGQMTSPKSKNERKSYSQMSAWFHS